MLNSIRYRLLTWFIAFMLLTAGLMIPASLIFQAKEKNITKVATDINALYIDFLTDTKYVNDFLTVEPENADFYARGESPYLIAHQKTSRILNSNLLLIRNSDQTTGFGISGELDQLAGHIHRYNIIFDSLVYLVYKRGYRNFGLEGELSDYAKLVEGSSGLNSRDIYLLQKTEHDYFFNKDTASVTTLINLVKLLNENISANSRLSTVEKRLSVHLVNSYADAFLRLVDLDRKAGISSNRALRASMNETSAAIEKLFVTISSKSQVAQKAIINRLKIFYIISLLLILTMAVMFSYRASKHVVSHLEALTNYISSLAKNESESGHSLDLRHSAREIKQIYREFRNLLSQLKIWEIQRDRAVRHADDNQQRYRELADMLPQSVFETDAYGNYNYVNKAWYQAFGYDPHDLHDGLNLIETLVSESNGEDILGEKKIENSTFAAVRKNGSRFPVSVYTDNILKNGKIEGRRGIIIDITDRVKYIKTLQQETSKAKSSDELKSSFLANMSHEIRTPMNSIIGFSNLLASDQIPDIQKKDFTHYIRSSSEILLNLVDDIIDIAKIEAGELKIVKKDCELTALGEELLTISMQTRNRFNKQHIGLEFKPEAGHEVCLKTDPFRLRQVMVNLINNAIKFTDRGYIEFGYAVKEDTLIEFYVRDTGPGLSREELDMIFERFKRARRSEEKNIVGTGLGLAIAKNLVQLMGGEMWVDSTAGVGTTFLFTLPYLRSTVLPAGKEHSYPTETAYNWHEKTILIVEDDPNSYKYLSEVLRKTRSGVLHASNGRQAIEMVSAHEHIDLVIMDIQLPEMDGLQATRLIKDMKPQLPVIAQTAYAMAGDGDKMKKAGCDDYMAKPLDSQQLLAVVHHFLFSWNPAVRDSLTTPDSPTRITTG